MKTAKKIDILTKPLSKIKPCLAQVIKDDGGIDWYENCQAGSIIKLETGGKKAYFNMDYAKVKNFNSNTPEKELLDMEEKIKVIKEDRDKFDKEREQDARKLSEELEKLSKVEQTKVVKGNLVKIKSDYDKRADKLKGKYVKLTENKIRNFGRPSKPLMGFVLYEKEFNALPNSNVMHDSAKVSEFVDSVMKNFKDFVAQRTEAMGKTALLIIAGLAILAFVIFRYGGDFFAQFQSEPAPEPTVAVISSFYYLIKIKVMKKNG